MLPDQYAKSYKGNGLSDILLVFISTYYNLLHVKFLLAKIPVPVSGVTLAVCAPPPPPPHSGVGGALRYTTGPGPNPGPNRIPVLVLFPVRVQNNLLTNSQFSKLFEENYIIETRNFVYNLFRKRFS